MKFFILNETRPSTIEGTVGDEPLEYNGSPMHWFTRVAKARSMCNRLNRELREQGKDDNLAVAEINVESYTKARELAKAAECRALKANRVAFATGCQELFSTYPKLKSFGWKQYVGGSGIDRFDFETTCHQPDINGIDGDELGCNWGLDHTGAQADAGCKSKPADALQKPVADFLEQFDDELMRDMFGDDVSITIHFDGTVEGEDYCSN